VRIGYGLSDLGERANAVYWFAVAALLVAFLADTASTLSAGADGWMLDRNPMVRALSERGYIFFSLGRAAVAVAFLSWFWPPGLVPRKDSTTYLLMVPFGYRSPSRYFGAALILVAIPLKLAAFCNNLLVINGFEPVPILLPIGFIAGVGFSNAVLFRQWKAARSEDRPGDSTVEASG
jgi:hypothetical protein